MEGSVAPRSGLQMCVCDEFHKFYETHHKEIEKYFFVFYVCSLREENKSYPILIRKKTNGSANDDIKQELEEIVIRCQNSGLEVIGISFDGDPKIPRFC